MRKIFFAVMFTIAVSACVTNQDSGTVIGGVAGGLLGNTIGKGSGRGIVHMPPAHYLPHPQEHECNDYITNPGAYDSCQRGIKHREHLEQKRLEREAFRRGAKK